MVEMKDVCVTYATGVDALKNMNLKINDGDFAFVVGPSGAGKSTLIKLILKEIDPTSGSVYVNGYHLNRLRRRKIPALRRTIGFVFQDFRLIPSMTVYDNIAFVLRVIDAPRKFIRKRVPYVISLVGLEGKAKAYPDQLSGGEKQRIALARASIRKTPILILDEATANLDNIIEEEIYTSVLKEKETMSIVVTHKLNNNILKQMDKIIVMKNGRVAECDTFENLYNKGGEFYNIYKVYN